MINLVATDNLSSRIIGLRKLLDRIKWKHFRIFKPLVLKINRYRIVADGFTNSKMSKFISIKLLYFWSIFKLHYIIKAKCSKWSQASFTYKIRKLSGVKRHIENIISNYINKKIKGDYLFWYMSSNDAEAFPHRSPFVCHPA